MQAESRSLAVGVFDTATQAERSVDELRRAGYAADQIGILEPDDTSEQTPSGPSALARAGGHGAAGAVIGGLLGAVTALAIPGVGPILAGGALATALSGAALGVTVGKIIGVLASLGLSEREATFFERQLEQGKTIVTINVAGRYQEALDILIGCGARWVDSTNTNFGAEPPAAARPE